MKKFTFILILFTVYINCNAQSLSLEESKLYNLIMNYRNELGLPSIPLSKSLTFVAQSHVKDLQSNEITNDRCNLHSWSSHGPWSQCCYTSDHAQANCMWQKPKEMTSYKGYGYEIAYGSYGANVTAASAIEGWKNSQGHNQVIINQGIWSSKKWNSIGIGMSQGYAVIWFGEEYDSN
jgi:uncharacterized protein YkwD